MQLCKLDVWVIVDSCGDSAVGATREDAIERYQSEIQALETCGGYRLVRLPVSVPIPEEQELAEVVIPELGAPKAPEPRDVDGYFGRMD